MARSSFVAFACPLVLGVVLALTGCKAKPGDKCSTGQLACANKSTGLFCGSDGKFATMSCNGPSGCTGAGPGVSCDNATAAENDGCNTVGDVACSTDKKAALECSKDNKFAVGETCKGTGGCAISGDQITCDNDTSDVGDPCHFIGDYACTTDKGLVLRCDDHKMTALNTCRGPKSCRIIPQPAQNKVEFACDDSVAQLGDACDTNGEEACSMDKKSLYLCKSNKFATEKACGGAGGCSYDEHADHFGCDTGGGAAGAAVAVKATMKKGK